MHYTIPSHVKYSCAVVSAMLGLQAEGTTLGADNGIGVAAALALLDMPTSAKLPPLECLFTIDEETGLTGMLPGPVTQCILHA
jgi:di/tripeptidase